MTYRIEHREGSFLGWADLSLFYQTWQTNRDAIGTLLLVHGLGSHSGSFDETARYFAQQGYQVYGFDLRGHGRSDGRRGHIKRWSNYRNDLRLFMNWVERQQVGPLFLWGHSLGGTIAMDFALHYPTAFDGLILSSPAFERVKVPQYKLLIGRLLSSIWPQFSLPSGLDQSASSRDPDVLAQYQNDPLRHHMGSARLATEFFATIDWIQHHLQAIARPILCLHGTADRITEHTSSRALFEQVTYEDKTYLAYPGGYHELFADLCKEQVLQDIHQWLSDRLPSENLSPSISLA